MGILQSSLIVSCGNQGPPNFCLHTAARMLRPALLTSLEYTDVETLPATENASLFLMWSALYTINAVD